jgi:hypothetical protein
MGNRKLAQFLGHLRSLDPDMPEDFLHTIWSSWLPTNMEAILAGQHEGSLGAESRRLASRYYSSFAWLPAVSRLPSCCKEHRY